VLQNAKGFALLEDEDVSFNIGKLKTKAYTQNIHKAGRLKRPKAESIQKTLEIKSYYEKHPEQYIDDICKEFGFSKTTYYRTIKWLKQRENR